MRVVIIKDYVKEHFPSTPLLDYALEVEKITTSKVNHLSPSFPYSLSLSLTHSYIVSLNQKVLLQIQKPNLILNVDGVIAVSFVDLLRQSGAFTPLALLTFILLCEPYTLTFKLHREECQEYVDIGSLNGLFVLGRTIGFVGM